MSNIDLRQAIVTEAQRQGVDPAIAVAVATRESGIMQWKPNGQLVIGKAGEIGIFQVMPSSAPGYDLSDPIQNIAAGVSILKQMFNRYGDWRYALAGYNWGPGKVDKYLAGLASLPSSVNSYISFVMSRAHVYNAGLQIKFKNEAAAGPAGSTLPDNGASASTSISAGGASKPALIIGAAAFGLAAWLALS
ncbi:MAG: lytic transglycosylase domain-containing protein [Terriglobales bacterium]